MKDIFAGNQVIHKMSDRYGWKEGSAEKTVLHGALGALTGTMSGGNALSGAVSGSVNEFALAYMEKTKGRDWMDTHPDTVQAISTALGAVAGSLTGDRNTGAYTAQMGTKWNRLAKKPQEDQNKQLKQELSTEKKNPDELLKLLTEYINMSEAAEHPASQKALHGVWDAEKGYTLPAITVSASEYKAIDQESFNGVAQKYNLPTKWDSKKNVQGNLESLRYDLERETLKGRTVFQSDWVKYGGYGLDFAGEVSKEIHLPSVSGWAGATGKMLDIGKFLTAEDRVKESVSIAGGIAGSMTGQRLLVPIIVGYGIQWGLPKPISYAGGGAVTLVVGATGAFTAETIYENKRDFIYYLRNLNSFDYDKSEFEKKIEQNFSIKD